MNYSTYIVAHLVPVLLGNAGKGQEASAALEQKLVDIFVKVLETTSQHSQDFLGQPITPESTFAWEHQLEEVLREAGRQVVQAVYQRVEPVVESLPKHVRFEASQYTRLNRKTPQNVWTLFGQIRLCRVGYRPSDKSGDPTIFPTALALGLIQGASPALAERAAGLMSDTGMTQRTVLKRLQQDHGVGWGVKKLRQVTAFLADELAEQRHDVQVEKLLELLDQATASTGKHKPVLSVGRDGITMGLRILAGTIKEVATCGTVTVLGAASSAVGRISARDRRIAADGGASGSSALTCTARPTCSGSEEPFSTRCRARRS